MQDKISIISKNDVRSAIAPGALLSTKAYGIGESAIKIAKCQAMELGDGSGGSKSLESLQLDRLDTSNGKIARDAPSIRLDIVPVPICLGRAIAQLGLPQFVPFSEWRPSACARLLATAHADAGIHIGEAIQGAVEVREVPASGRDLSIMDSPHLCEYGARSLINLPCPQLRSNVWVKLTPGTGIISSTPANAIKAQLAVRSLMVLLGIDRLVDVEIVIYNMIPIGRGLGTSSADVSAALRALAVAGQFELPEEILDYLSVCAERATNPSGLKPTIFLHRLGLTVATAPGWPKLRIIGLDDPEAPNVNTDEHPPATYSEAEFDKLCILHRATIAACRVHDPIGFGRFCMESAEINERFLPRTGNSSLRQLHEIRQVSGAVGFCIAHTGTVAAMLFSGEEAGFDRRASTARAMLRERNCNVFAEYDLG